MPGYGIFAEYKRIIGGEINVLDNDI